MPAAISRHVARVGNRDVHYRRAGAGPALIVLHQSPRSNEECLPLFERFSDRYTVIAPDTPGNGMSDPLPMANPSMKDFADALAALMSVLGLSKAMVYGFHTGAMCAFELAHHHPDRVVVSVVNGYVHPGEVEQSEILQNYFVPLVPDWSGSHLLWAWARMREQFIFYPWFRKDPASRMHYGAPPPLLVHEWVMDLLRAGDAYRGAYTAAFSVDLATAASEVRCPTVVMTAEADWPLYPHLENMPPPSQSLSVHRPAGQAEALDILTAALEKHAADSPIPPSAPPKPIDVLAGGFIRVRGLDLYARLNLSGAGLPIMFVHSSGGSAFEAEAAMSALAGQRPVLSIDRAGNGESDPDPLHGSDVGGQAAYLADALAALKIDAVEIVACEGGSAVAMELALQHPDMVKRVTVSEGFVAMATKGGLDPVAYAPQITVTSDGAHLIGAWAMVREMLLFRPWISGQGQVELNPAPAALDPAALNRATLDVLKARLIFHTAARAHLAYDFAGAKAGLACELILSAAH